jgi:DNA topoisomerase-3
MKRPGTYASSPVTSSPIRRRRPPQAAQAPAPGVSSTSIRGIWSGIGRRFGLSFSSASGSFIRAVIAAAAISLVSRASCRCSAVSEDAPNRCARCPANWCRSFSIKLQVEAARRFKWSVQKTTDVLQALYEANAVTYPRSSETSLPETEISNAPAMLTGLLRVPCIGPVSWAYKGPTIRVKAGAFSDRALKGAAHFAIVPNPNTAPQWPTLYAAMTTTEQRLFEIIARRYLAAIGPDRSYDSTRQWVKIDGREFTASGAVEIEAGWREALSAIASDDECADPAESAKLPAFVDGDDVQVFDSGVAEKQTTPPSRYTDASLIVAMIEAWRHVSDPEISVALKETEGIGTEATRKDIVVNLMSRGFIEQVDRKGGALKPSEAGMQFCNILEEATPALLDVGLTGWMEILLERIKSGDAKPVAVVNEIVAVAEDAIGRMVAASERGAAVSASQAGQPKKKRATAAPRRNGASAPTETALAFAHRIAGERAMEIPDDVRKDAAKLSAWIDAKKDVGRSDRGGRTHATSGRHAKPTPKQVGFAEKIAKRRGIEIPAESYQDRVSLSKWIDTHR